MPQRCMRIPLPPSWSWAVSEPSAFGCGGEASHLPHHSRGGVEHRLWGRSELSQCVSGADLREGEAVGVTDSCGEPFAPPDWRKHSRGHLDMPADGVWPAADVLTERRAEASQTGRPQFAVGAEAERVVAEASPASVLGRTCLDSGRIARAVDVHASVESHGGEFASL